MLGTLEPLLTRLPPPTSTETDEAHDLAKYIVSESASWCNLLHFKKSSLFYSTLERQKKETEEERRGNRGRPDTNLQGVAAAEKIPRRDR